MVLMHEPIRFFGPPAALLGFAGFRKLVYDLIDKSFRVGANTIIILGGSPALAEVWTDCRPIVQLNKRRHDVMANLRRHAVNDLFQFAKHFH